MIDYSHIDESATTDCSSDIQIVLLSRALLATRRPQFPSPLTAISGPVLLSLFLRQSQWIVWTSPSTTSSPTREREEAQGEEEEEGEEEESILEREVT